MCAWRGNEAAASLHIVYTLLHIHSCTQAFFKTSGKRTRRIESNYSFFYKSTVFISLKCYPVKMNNNYNCNSLNANIGHNEYQPWNWNKNPGLINTVQNIRRICKPAHHFQWRSWLRSTLWSMDNDKCTNENATYWWDQFSHP